MTSYTNKHASHTAHQTVTEEFIEMATAGESIRIGFTDQKSSGRAGLATFCGFLGWHRFGELLARELPPARARGRPRRRRGEGAASTAGARDCAGVYRR